MKPHANTDALAFFGPDQDGLRGKTVRVKPEKVEAEYVDIPRDFYRLHRFVTLVGDVMFVNGMPFLLTLSRKLSFGTVEFLTLRTAPQLCRSLLRFMRLLCIERHNCVMYYDGHGL